MNVVTNLEMIDNPQYFEERFVDVPLRMILSNSILIPSDWKLTLPEEAYIKSITPTEHSCRYLE